MLGYVYLLFTLIVFYKFKRSFVCVLSVSIAYFMIRFSVWISWVLRLIPNIEVLSKECKTNLHSSALYELLIKKISTQIINLDLYTTSYQDENTTNKIVMKFYDQIYQKWKFRSLLQFLSNFVLYTFILQILHQLIQWGIKEL